MEGERPRFNAHPRLLISRHVAGGAARLSESRSGKPVFRSIQQVLKPEIHGGSVTEFTPVSRCKRWV